MNGVSGVLLAAGLGTRLRPLTERTPKPLLPVAGMEPLFFALARQFECGLRRVVVNAHHLPEQIEQAVKQWTPLFPGLELRVSREHPEILGSGGGLIKIAREQRDWFGSGRAMFVQNADTISALSPELMLQRPTENLFCVSTLPAHLKKFNALWVNVDGSYAGLGKIPPSPNAQPTHMLGMQYFSAAAVDAMAKFEPRSCDVFSGVYRPLTELGYRLSAVEAMKAGREAFWFDLANVQDLQEASAAMERENVWLQVRERRRQATA